MPMRHQQPTSQRYHVPAHRARPRRWLEAALVIGWSLLVVGLVVQSGRLPSWR